MHFRRTTGNMDLDESSLRILRLKVDSTTGVVYRGKEWPKKTVPLEAEGRVAVLSQDDRLQVLDPASGSLADLECLTGEPVSDACRLPAAASGESDGERRPPLALLVVVTASGRALKVDPLRDAVVGAVDGDLRVEQSEPGMSPVRGKGKSVGEETCCVEYARSRETYFEVGSPRTRLSEISPVGRGFGRCRFTREACSRNLIHELSFLT